MKPIYDFFDVWGEADAEPRDKMIRFVMAETFIYIDPRTQEPITNIDTLTSYIGNFSKAAPGAKAELARLSTSDHDYHRATVVFTMADGAHQYGQYYVETDRTNRITKLVGFPGIGDPQQ